MNRAHRFFIALATSMFFILPVAAQQRDPVVELQTTRGNIYIRIFSGAVPRTASNFLDLVSRGFYDGKIFHRIESWCIQGGDPNGNGTGDFVDPNTGQVRYVPLEINRRLSHSCAGVVAMARKNNPNSASCQFYITKQSTKFLDGRYAIFGQVVQGLNAVRNMQRGDQIVSARIVDSQSGNNRGNASPPAQTRPRGGPTPEYEPTSEIPDSGF
ncbi:MAG: peptidylprolyl isomerase [Candidatus Melainabacteria bacterium]|nr:peptidylprolyl isomerase [Candidatus Melainabacteria bacterium]